MRVSILGYVVVLGRRRGAGGRAVLGVVGLFKPSVP